MKRTIAEVLAVCLLSQAHATDICVKTTGADGNAGTREAPVRSLSRALELARAADDPVTIRLKGGRYNPEGVAKLTEADSGKPGAPLVIRAVPGEKVTFSRGAAIPSKLFARVTDGALAARLHPSARGKVVSASLAGTGLGRLFPYRPDDNENEAYALVTWNGHCLQQAQWPNRGYAYMKEVPDKGPTTRWLAADEKPAAYGRENPTGGRFTLRESIDLAALRREIDRTGDIMVHGYLNNDWFFQKENLGAVQPEKKALRLLRYTRYGIGNKKLPLPRRLRLINVLCQLDEPGEWYYDHLEERFYFWPVQPLTDDKPLRIAGGETLIEGCGVKHVTLRDITFEDFGDNGVIFTGCDHVTIGGCVFRNGVDLGLRLVDGMHNTITGCDFYGLERAFLLLGKYPVAIEYESQYEKDINIEYNASSFSESRRALVPEHNVANNNHIHHCRLRGYGLMAVGGVGARFTHNLVHDLNGGMMYGHNDFLAEYNEFYNVGYEMGDWNAAYCGADLSLYNNLFRFNFVHHLLETPKGHPMSAWRADDNASGLLTFGNIYYKCARSCVQGSGPACSIENSVSMQTSLLWWTGQKPYHQISKEQFLRDKQAERIKTNEDIAAGTRIVFCKVNLIGRAEMIFGREGWKNNETWRTKYPVIPKIFADFMDPDCNPWCQSHSVVRRNYSDRPSYKTFHIHGRNKLESFEAQKKMLPGSMVFELPVALDVEAMFVDAGRMDFRQRPDFAPVDGFVEIPFERIGLYIDEHRTSMPEKAVYRMAIKKRYEDTPSFGGRFDYDKLNERYPVPPYTQPGTR
jgi:hypothetical protein